MTTPASDPIGDIGLLSHPNKTAFLTSRRTPDSCRPAIREWLDSLSPEGECVMIGGIQKIEGDVLLGLLRRRVPTVLVLAEPMPKMWPIGVVEAIGEGRLLVLTTADFLLPWVDKYGMAADRNKFMVANAERVVVAMCRPGGFISRQVQAAKAVTYLTAYNPWPGTEADPGMAMAAEE